MLPCRPGYTLKHVHVVFTSFDVKWVVIVYTCIALALYKAYVRDTVHVWDATRLGVLVEII